MEYTVGAKLLKVSELQLKELNGSQFVYNNKYSSMKIEDVPQSEVASFFTPTS